MLRGDIVLIELPRPGGSAGHEQFGTRPALIVHSDETIRTVSVIMIIPFTSRLSAQRFPHTILIQPSPANGLRCPSALLVFQLRAIDRRRIQETIGHLEAETLTRVEAEMRRLLDL